jgi:hypothetical protein
MQTKQYPSVSSQLFNLEEIYQVSITPFTWMKWRVFQFKEISFERWISSLGKCEEIGIRSA